METQLMLNICADFDLWTFASGVKCVLNWHTWVIDVCDPVYVVGAAICVVSGQSAPSKAQGQQYKQGPFS